MSEHPVLWRPAPQLVSTSNLTKFVEWAQQAGYAPPAGQDYEALWRWSVEDISRFWHAIFRYNDILFDGELPAQQQVVIGDIEQAEWFEGVKLNYAEHILRNLHDDKEALIVVREGLEPRTIFGGELRREVVRFRQNLLGAGVGEGDRVVGFLPNTEHAIIAFLATASLGAIWSCCSPDFGAEAVLDRFQQIEPRVLIACRGYGYGGKYVDRSAVAHRLAQELPTVELQVWLDLDAPDDAPAGWQAWSASSTTSSTATLECNRLAFAAPLWILFSSGTTGKPKAIVHGHGGCLLEHFKYLFLQADVRAREHFFWFTTTGWMMWNFLQASILVDAVPVLYDGSPGFPSLRRLWRLAEALPIHHFGTSAPFIHACERADYEVASQLDLSSLRSIGSTGAPLSEHGFAYIYSKVKSDVWLTSMSGGTDVCTAFVGGTPYKPVRQGVIQCRALGCDLHAYTEAGEPVVGQVGELVVRQPMPSMPIMFWDDPEGEHKHDSYFSALPGVWRHGDWISVDEEGGVVIYGRSDATLNRQGVRIGTAEIYRVVAGFTEVEDALIINYVDANSYDHMPLFVKMKEGAALSDSLRQNLKRALREGNSPRHVPTQIESVEDIPYTISGKKLEAPVKRLFLGAKLEEVANLGALRNPAALEAFARLATKSRAQC